MKQKEENEKLIEQIVRDAGYSSMTNKAIVKKIREKLASVVIFGSETEIAEQTEKYLEVAHIFCADEVGAERRVSMIMMTYQIPEEYRDALILKLSRGAKGDNMVKTIAQGDVILQNEAAQGFAENLQFWIKTLEKTGIYRRALSRKQWKEIDKLRRYAGVFERESFSRELTKDTTSERSWKVITGNIGPKISSCITGESGETLSRRVGSIHRRSLSECPPARMVAPAR